jgi:hypothetical protein
MKIPAFVIAAIIFPALISVPVLNICIDTGKDLGVWVTSQFYEINSDSTSHSKRM